jgi:hypothetical protein
MRSQIKSIRRPLTDEELSSDEQNWTGGKNVNDLLERVSLRDVPLAERRREAKKPLYLIRSYE